MTISATAEAAVSHLRVAPDILTWKSSAAPMRFRDLLKAMAIITLVYALMIVAMGLLALLLVTPFVLWRGENWLEIAASWVAPQMWLGGLGIALTMAALPYLLVGWFTRIEAFEFDAQHQSLQVLERRAWLQARCRTWALADIEQVVPSISGSSGYLRLLVRNKHGKTRSLELGENFSASELERQANWLRAYLGPRVHPLVEYEGD